MLIAVNQLGFGSVVPVLALYARSFDVPQTAIGAAIAAYGLARFLIAMPAGHLADHLGRRGTLALGGLVSAIGNLLCAYAPTFPAFIGARFVAGAGAALVLTAGQIVLADITEPAYRGRTMAIYQGVFLFAVGVGPLPGGLLAQHLGLAAPFLAYAVYDRITLKGRKPASVVGVEGPERPQNDVIAVVLDDLLAHLVRHAGKVLTHRALLGAVWGGDYTEQHEYLRVFIGQLRKKIEPDSSRPRYILTEPWIGYRFNCE